MLGYSYPLFVRELIVSSKANQVAEFVVDCLLSNTNYNYKLLLKSVNYFTLVSGLNYIIICISLIMCLIIYYSLIILYVLSFCLLLKGSVEYVYFYIDTIFGLHAMYMVSLFVSSWLLSGSWLAGLLSASFYIFNK